MSESSCKGLCEANADCKSILYYPYLSSSFKNCKLSTKTFTLQSQIDNNDDNSQYGGAYTTYWRDFSGSSCVTHASKNSKATCVVKTSILTIHWKTFNVQSALFSPTVQWHFKYRLVVLWAISNMWSWRGRLWLRLWLYRWLKMRNRQLYN